MDKELVKIIAEGLVKAKNKARKKDLETYGHNESPKAPEVGKRALGALHKAKNDKSGARMRATFRGNRALEASLVEGLVKAMNKAKKSSMEGSTPKEKQASRSLAKKDVTRDRSGAMNKNAEGHAGLDAAGVMRRQGKKAVSKIFLKASKRARKGQDFTALESAIVAGIGRLLEGRDDATTDDDSISNAGGDPKSYQAIKAAKQKAAGVKKSAIPGKRNVGPRMAALGKMGGYVDKQGKKWQSPKPASAEKFAKSDRTPPMSRDQIDRAKGSGKEGEKADANDKMFGKLVAGLAKKGK